MDLVARAFEVANGDPEVAYRLYLIWMFHKHGPRFVSPVTREDFFEFAEQNKAKMNGSLNTEPLWESPGEDAVLMHHDACGMAFVVYNDDEADLVRFCPFCGMEAEFEGE